ncbi:MAG TPA: hypothetical protein VKC90_05160 [Chitinophagaceae bacterium]|nr:hypothetical protein [Chitinophagaceae bacterium]
MPRIQPISEKDITPSIGAAFKQHVSDYNTRITNMKATLAHSPLVFEVYMQWYPLYDEVKKILGERLAYLYAYSISYASNCPLCSVYFRKMIIDAGESPEKLELSLQEKKVLDFGSAIAKHQGNIADCVYKDAAEKYSKEEMVLLIAFAGQMIATNIFNNVIETEIDEYLANYLPVTTSIWENAR